MLIILIRLRIENATTGELLWKLLKEEKIAEFNIRHKQDPYIILNLVAADLQGAKLGGAKLGGGILMSANLKGAELIETDLKGAELRRS